MKRWRTQVLRTSIKDASRHGLSRMLVLRLYQIAFLLGIAITGRAGEIIAKPTVENVRAALEASGIDGVRIEQVLMPCRNDSRVTVTVTADRNSQVSAFMRWLESSGTFHSPDLYINESARKRGTLTVMLTESASQSTRRQARRCILAAPTVENVRAALEASEVEGVHIDEVAIAGSDEVRITVTGHAGRNSEISNLLRWIDGSETFRQPELVSIEAVPDAGVRFELQARVSAPPAPPPPPATPPRRHAFRCMVGGKEIFQASPCPTR